MKMLQSYEPKKYTIITKQLLLTLANEQQSKTRRRRTISNLAAISEIRLEYLNILQVDCLWPLTNLVKLKLNNNVIEKIENLECLTNLCELDLSFNRITVIENLETLTNIHVLSFYENQIEIVQGLDNMKNLTILSFGKNNILDLDHVLYLRQFKELRSLQMTGNPCTERSGYINYLIAFVPQIMYYSYKLITEKERNDANEKHSRALNEMIEAEAKKQKELEAAEELEKKVIRLSASYVEYLDDDCLFQQMFDKDDDGKRLAKLTPECEEAYAQYRLRFSETCYQLYEFGLEEENRRRAEIDALNSVIEERLASATEKARTIMESVKSKRVEIRVRVRQKLREAALAAEDDNIEDDVVDMIDKLASELSAEFNQYTNTVWIKLMNEETIVHEQIEEISKMFEINITDMVTAFLEMAQEYFSQLRSLETDYYETMLPIVMTYLNSLEDEDKDPFLLSLTEDKDALSNSMSGSHFMHVQTIDDRQDRMVKRLREWQTKFLQNLVEDETARSRNHILEISHSLDHHRRSASVSSLVGQQSIVEDEEVAEKPEVAEATQTASNAEDDSEAGDQRDQ